MSTGVAIAIAFITLLGNAFFVGAEFGLISARRSSIEPKALNGSRSARITLDAMERVTLMLSGSQIGVTFCSLVLGAVSEPLIAHFLEGPFTSIGLPHDAVYPVALALALSVMTYLHVVFGEMIPKNIAIAGPERVALLLTPPLVLFVKVIGPVVQALNKMTDFAVGLFGIKPKHEVASSFTRDEVAGFVEESRREGLLIDDEHDLLSSALQLDERTCGAVLLPLTTLTTVSPSVTAYEIECLSVSTGYSRFPVLDEQNKMTGYVHLKDVLAIPEAAYNDPLPQDTIRPLAKVRATSSLRRGLSIMRRLGTHLAIVTDSSGIETGIVTLEDVVEELVGEIRDEANRTVRP